MDINQLAQLFMMVVVTGLGGAKLLEMWQAHKLKTAEKQLDHDMAKEDKAIDYIISQSEKYRLQVEDLQNNKMVQIQANLAHIAEQMNPCANLLKELLINRETMQALINDLNMTVKTQNEALKLIGERLRVDMRRVDSSGMVNDLIDQMSDTGHHRRHRSRQDTGQIPTQQ